MSVAKLVLFILLCCFLGGCTSYSECYYYCKIYRLSTEFIIDKYNFRKDKNDIYIYEKYSQKFDDNSFNFPILKDSLHTALIKQYKISSDIMLDKTLMECLEKELPSITFITDKSFLFKNKEDFKIIFDYPLVMDRYVCQVVHYKIGRLDAGSILLIIEKVENNYKVIENYSLLTI